jgi:hypothetical protein
MKRSRKAGVGIVNEAAMLKLAFLRELDLMQSIESAKTTPLSS